MISQILRQLREVPEYFIALKAALAILAMGLPLYLGLRYFLYRRKLIISFWATLNFVNAFILFAGLAFLLASPLASYVPSVVVTAYLFITCIAATLSVVSMVDVFFIQHYLTHVKKIYVSPPLRTIIKLGIFCVVLLPVLRFVLHFNPLALVAIPTIATAGLALALQDTLKTFIAGVALGKIIRLGEWISFQDKEGQVVDINWARTVLRTTDGNFVFIPNTQLQTGVFLNYTTGDPSNRLQLKLGVSYDTPPARVRQVMASCAINVPGVAREPEPYVRLLDYGESAVTYSVFYWLEDYSKRLQVQDEVATRIWYAFRREGIEIPYPIRTVYMRQATETAKHRSDDIARNLQQWALAKAFYPEELVELGRFTTARDYAAGEMIVHEGDPGQSLFVIASGAVGIFKKDQPDTALTVLKQGEIFGEMSFLTGEPRSADVRAQEPVMVLEIDKAGLHGILARRPELTTKLAELVVQRERAGISPASQPPTVPNNSQESPKLAGRIRSFFGL